MASGGIIPKSLLGFAMESARFAASTSGYYPDGTQWFERLLVDCPLSGAVRCGANRAGVVVQIDSSWW